MLPRGRYLYAVGISGFLLVLGTLSVAGPHVGPRASGDHHKGSFKVPLFRGFAVQPEGTVLELPNNCEREMQLEVRWNEENNQVTVKSDAARVAGMPWPSQNVSHSAVERWVMIAAMSR